MKWRPPFWCIDCDPDCANPLTLLEAASHDSRNHRVIDQAIRDESQLLVDDAERSYGKQLEQQRKMEVR